jgi:CBS domain-containing protein
MQVGREPGRAATVAEVLWRVEDRETPAVATTASLYDVMRMFHRCPHSQSVYVVDADMQLLGAVALPKLVRHSFSHSHEPQVHARGVLGLIAHETAADLMRKRPLCARTDEEIGPVLERMVRRNHNDVPVVDGKGVLVGDITLVDLLEFLMEEEADEEESETPEGEEE